MIDPLPPDLERFLERPNPAVMATIRPDGTPHTAATWYERSDERLLVTMDAWRQRLRFLRANPAVSLTVLGVDDWYQHVTFMGRVCSIEKDVDLVDYQRLAKRYGRSPGRLTDRHRVSILIEVERWYAWDANRQTPR